MTGIIAAMQPELEGLRSKIKDPVTENIYGSEFVRGRLGNAEVVTVQCGIGKVAAAMCAQTLILRYSPSLIINTGVGGSLSEKLGVGDIAIAESLVQHDMDTTPIGDAPGFIHSLGEVFMPADERAKELLLKAAREEGLNAISGVIASGDQFIADPEKKSRIVSLFNAIACEMEGAAIAQVCRTASVPFAVIRAISDNADGSADMTYEEFLPVAAANAQRLTERFLGEY